MGLGHAKRGRARAAGGLRKTPSLEMILSVLGVDMKNVCWPVHTGAIARRDAQVHSAFRCLDRQFKCRISVVADV
jgi:hypothetical protein